MRVAHELLPSPKWDAMAAASAGMVYSAGITCVSSPKPAAVARVIGPIDATVTPSMSRPSSARENSAQKFRTVDELVNVTTWIRRAASAARRPAECSRAARVW